MQMQDQSQIIQRAYQIWEQEGRPEGRALDHWLRAEAEVDLPAKPAKRSTKGTRAAKASVGSGGRKTTRAKRS